MNSSEDSSLIMLINSINSKFSLIAAIVLTIVGVIGNPIVFFILTKSRFRNVSIFRYSIVSVVNDSFVLITMWPYNFPEAFQMNTSSISCKLSQYFGYLFYQFCSWIIVLSSIDRLLSVKYATRFQFRNKLKYQALALSVIFVVILFLDIPFYSYFDIHVQSNNSTLCATNDIFIQFYIDLTNLLISTIIPFFIMVLCTILIGHTLITQKSRLMENRRTYKKELQYVKVLYALDAFFLICNLPFCIQQLISDGFTINNKPYFFQTFIFNVTNSIIYIQNAFAFFVYFISNKGFRKYFLSIIIPNNRVGDFTISTTNLTRTRNDRQGNRSIQEMD